MLFRSIWLTLTSLPDRTHTPFATLVLIFLSITGAIAAGSGLVLAAFYIRGAERATGVILALLALAYTLVSGLLLLTGIAA